MSGLPPRRFDWKGFAVSISIQCALLGALLVGYGVVGRRTSDQLAGLLMIAAGATGWSYSWRRRRVGEDEPRRRRMSLRLTRPPRRPLAVWLWVVAAWVALGLSAIATSPALEVASIAAVFGCIFAGAILEMRG